MLIFPSITLYDVVVVDDDDVDVDGEECWN